MSLDPVPLHHSPPSSIVIYAVRCYLFRIMMGAGLIKLRSHDPKWKWPEFSTMNYFYETQPVPNPLSRYFHFLPAKWHQFEVLMNHFVELVAPWLLLIPICGFRRAGGWIQIMFQLVLITSGNLSFLNWLTMVPAILCLDDEVWAHLFSVTWQQRAIEASQLAQSSVARAATSLAFGCLIAVLSIPVLQNLCSRNQQMNASL